jgi:hypothetical protein
MKIKSKYHHFLIIAVAASTAAQLQAVTTVGDTLTPDAPGSTTVTIAGNATVNGTLSVQLPNAAPVSAGTAPAPTSPIGNAQNTGFTVPPASTGQIFAYSTNGSGLQTQVVQTNGGVIAQTNGDLTLQQQKSQTDTATYTIESRDIKVSNPAGFTDTLGTYGPIGAFYANGTSLPGTAVIVATLRDGSGNLLSVLSDLPGVGPVTATDGSGFPILTPAQVTAAVAGGAPVGFLVAAPSITTAGTGDLVVEGSTTTNGIDNSGKTITNVAAGIVATDAANVGQVTAGDAAVTTAFQAADAAEVIARIADVDAEEARALAAEGVLTTNLASEVTRATNAEGVLTTNLASEVTNRIADVNAEEARALAAEGVLTTNLASEVTTRTNADLSIRNDYTAADALERNARIAADDQIRSDYKAADSRLRGDIDQNTRGIAMVAAMTNTTVEAGKTHGVDFNVAQFQDETGMSFGYANRINDCLQIHAAAASTTDFDEAVARIGMSFQW